MYAEQEFKSTLDRNSENYTGYELKGTLDWNKTITMDMNGNNAEQELKSTPDRNGKVLRIESKKYAAQ